MTYRKLRQRLDMQATADGDGVKIHRIAGKALYSALDPFLLIDEIRSEQGADYIGGFPDHPHRGFETITYMLEGSMRHRDHLGNNGVIGSGDVQWMTAGRGVIHSEMPEQKEGLLHGFQIWLNLPAAEKMQPANYQDYRSAQFPRFSLPQGGEAKVIAGSIKGGTKTVTGPIEGGITRPLYLDIRLMPGEVFELDTDSQQNILILVFQGATTELQTRQLGIYSSQDQLRVQATEQGAHLLILAGSPLREPVAQYGPFVMNTPEELQEALRDYNEGKLVA